MLQSQTLFVIGAGASHEVGLPIGQTLKEQIARLVDIRFEDGYNQSSGDHKIAHALRQRGNGDINPYLYKAWRVRDALPTAISIDNLLDAHRGDDGIDLCGKLAIVRAILQAEGSSALKHLGTDGIEFSFSTLADTWLIPLFQLITENVRVDRVHEIPDRVSFIIFNYDRVVEHFLPFALANYYDIPLSKAEEIVSRIEFIHPYGKVGSLPFQNSQPKVKFGSDRYDIGEVAENIRTFAEGFQNKSFRENIRSLIYNSETIVFLGFAYHPMNMAALSMDLPPPLLRRIFGTTFGLSQADESVVESDILRIFRKRDPALAPISFEEIEPGEELESIDLKPLKSADFLGQYFRSIGARA